MYIIRIRSNIFHLDLNFSKYITQFIRFCIEHYVYAFSSNTIRNFILNALKEI